MPRYLVAGGRVPGGGARSGGLEEGALASRVAERLVAEVRARRAEAELVPTELDLGPTIEWVNAHARPGDVTLELHFNSAASAQARGWLVATMPHSFALARKIGRALGAVGVPPWSRGQGGSGVFHEQEIAAMRGWQHLGFVHQTEPPALLVELAFITSPDDMRLLRNSRRVARLLAIALAGRRRERLVQTSVWAPRRVAPAALAARRREEPVEMQDELAHE